MDLIESALLQVRQLASTANESFRRKLMTALHELAYSMEEPDDTIHRYGYLHLQTAAVKVGFDIQLFKRLTEEPNPSHVEHLAGLSGADSDFLRRYMSYLSSIGAIDEAGKEEYVANKVTRNLATRVAEAGISHCFMTIGPQYQALPEFFKRTGYKNPTDELHTVFQDAWKTGVHAFSWFVEHPHELRYFNDYMAFRREPEVSWLTVYPVQQETEGLHDPSRPLYVNMGGGVGHQCAQFKSRYPHLPGRVILQDLDHSIKNALPTPEVENMAHNFFEPQPVLGAKFYFLRGVLHNHPDHKVKRLLMNVKAAMSPDSILLIDEMVLPESHVNSYAASMDMTMMAAFAASERSEEHWRRILDEAGLTLFKLYAYNPVSYENVMDVRVRS